MRPIKTAHMSVKVGGGVFQVFYCLFKESTKYVDLNS